MIVVAVLVAVLVVVAVVLLVRHGGDTVEPAPLESGEPREALRAAIERRAK